jgi:dipeptidyl aminopeptidase/acylaminoacyl peptidase
LMLWHGGQDERVPFAESERLVAELGRRGLTRNLRFISEPQATHKIIVKAAESGVAFFQEKL